MTAEPSVPVQILNRTYLISHDEQDPEEIQRVAAYLDGKMRAAAAAVGQRSPLDVAIMAAMEIAGEVLELKRRKEDLLDDVDQRITRFTRRLESERLPPSSGQPD